MSKLNLSVKEQKDFINLLIKPGMQGSIAFLLSKGISVNLNKVKIIKYIMENEGESINNLSKELKIDYKNCWRIIEEFRKVGIVYFEEEISQGKKAKLKLNKVI